MNHEHVIANDGTSVLVWRRDLPAVADRRHFEVALTEEDLRALLNDLRLHQLELTADRTGGL